MSDGIGRRVAAVTGAGQGLGRSEALELARSGCAVVVNDVNDVGAQAVVDEISAVGGEATAFIGDCSDYDTAAALVDTAVHTFGTIDAVVNNAGINRDSSLLKMSQQQWEAVTRMHLDSTFAVTQHACRHFKEHGGGRVVCTTSTAGILGNFGQTNYGSAKAGIATFAIIAALELARYGITCNVIAPSARTAMTAALVHEPEEVGAFDFWDPDNVAPFVAFLCSEESGHISGKVFGVVGDAVELYQPYTAVAMIRNGEQRWDHTALVDRVSELFAESGIEPGATNPMDRRRFKMIG